jgi:chromate transport protein ChrA
VGQRRRWARRANSLSPVVLVAAAGSGSALNAEIFGRQLVAVAENRRIRPLLLGVTAGVIGLIAAVAVDVIETGVVDVPTALLAVGAFLVLNRYHGKLTVLYVVLGCGAIGAALQATVV